MKIRIRNVKGVSVLDISGKIDIHSAELIEVLCGLLKYNKTDILCNLQNVEQVDYDGLSIFAIAYKNVLNQKGRMKFCSVSSSALSLFRTVHLDSVFEIYDNEEDALKSFKAPLSEVEMEALRRRFKRLDIHIKALYSLLSRPNKTYEGILSNISGAGIYVMCKKAYPVKTKLNLQIKLPDISEPLNCTGIVVWNADKEIQPHEYPGMGVQFINISSGLQKKILSFIDKNVSHRSGRGLYTE